MLPLAVMRFFQQLFFTRRALPGEKLHHIKRPASGSSRA